MNLKLGVFFLFLLVAGSLCLGADPSTENRHAVASVVGGIYPARFERPRDPHEKLWPTLSIRISEEEKTFLVKEHSELLGGLEDAVALYENPTSRLLQMRKAGFLSIADFAETRETVPDMDALKRKLVEARNAVHYKIMNRRLDNIERGIREDDSKARYGIAIPKEKIAVIEKKIPRTLAKMQELHRELTRDRILSLSFQDEVPWADQAKIDQKNALVGSYSTNYKKYIELEKGISRVLGRPLDATWKSQRD